jgi:hypothetical protein
MADDAAQPRGEEAATVVPAKTRRPVVEPIDAGGDDSTVIIAGGRR